MERTVKLLTTTGNGQFEEVDWVKPEITDNEIEVRAVMTGVCRSDIDMMMGQFALPQNMHGHEGLGIVTAVGHNISDQEAKIGDYVATRGEPAYADYYNAKIDTFVKVPALESKYILEPIACAINIFDQINKVDPKGFISHTCKICILGTGLLASVVYQTLRHNSFTNIHVVGNYNAAYWLLKHSIEVKLQPIGQYDIVIDLANNNISFTQNIYEGNSLLVMAAAKHPPVIASFDNLLWNAVTICCPSPRSDTFIGAMHEAERLITHGIIDIGNFWSKGYNRNTEWQQAFTNSVNRTDGFNRAYIYWP